VRWTANELGAWAGRELGWTG